MKRSGWLRRLSRSLPGARTLELRVERLARRLHSPGKSKAGSETGQAVIEVALALPLIAAFSFTIIELSLAFYTNCMISESAREGTRYAIVRGATCQTASGASCTATASAINSTVTSLKWPNLGNGTLSANTTFPDGNENPGSRVQVVVSYVFPYNIPFAPKGSLHMASTSVMYIVQ